MLRPNFWKRDKQVRIIFIGLYSFHRNPVLLMPDYKNKRSML